MIATPARWWLVAAALMTIASAAALALLASGEIMASAIRDPLAAFVQPGVAVWWLVLGGPFRSAPASGAGIAFAAAANAALWWVVLWLVAVIVRAVRRV